MSDDARARHLLAAIEQLAAMLYPVDEGSDINSMRFYALGYIRGVASAALEDPPRCPAFEEVFGDGPRNVPPRGTPPGSVS
jgi:hypothetical protein